jgi:hypothetical protein
MGPSCQSVAPTAPVDSDSVGPNPAGTDRNAGSNHLYAKETFASEATAAGLLLVELGVPRPTARGRLAFFIDGAIERALDARGAPAPRISVASDFDASLDDQVERARTSGASGIALWFGPLQDVAKADILDCEDSAAIRRLVRACEHDNLRLGFDPRNHALSAYPAPQPFESIVGVAKEEPAPQVPSAGPSTEELETSQCDDVISSDPEIAKTDAVPEAADAPAPNGDHDELLAESARAMADELNGDENSDWLREALIELSTPKPRPAMPEVRAALHEVTEDAGHHPEVHPEIQDDFEQDGETPEPTPMSSSDARPFHIAFAEATAEPPKPAIDPEFQKRLESHARELEFANGPKPLAVVERLFASAYVPLRAALDRGTDLPSLLETADEWARSFEKSYSEAFDALRMRTKRPKMIPDVPDIAMRIGRLHGARSVQLLLVDGMRYDMGERVHERLRELAGQRAACADRFIMWSALPTRTATQVELLGRGVPGLREFTGEVSEDLVVARGRKASMIRRLKTGHREVLKLDVVEARLGEPGGVTPERLDGIADEVAQRVAAYFEDLQPRTLVMVFGDHGFRLTRGAEGIVTARQGAASPDEVLVPAFAWLVGAVH